jgi:hypothetical protein
LERRDRVNATDQINNSYFVQEVNNLIVGVPLFTRVAAHNYEGFSSYAPSAVDHLCPPRIAPCSFKTPAYPPDPPTHALLTVPTSTSLKVDFPEVRCKNATIDPCHGLAQRTVLLEWSTSGFPIIDGSSVHNVTDMHGNISFVIPNLKNGRRYFVRLSVSNGIGYGGHLLTDPIFAVPAGDGLTATKAAGSCKLIKDNFPSSQTGIYWLNPSDVTPFKGYCDMDTTVGSDSSGWTLVTKLKDIDATLDNHISHKFVGATWYSDDVASLTTVGNSTPSANKTLLPFAQDDGFWGSYDAALFTHFTQIMVYYNKHEDRVDDNSYYVFEMDHDAWTNFPAEVTKNERCIQKRQNGGEHQSCETGEYLSYMGDNENKNYYLTSSCATDDRQSSITKYQSLCIRSRFTEDLYLGYNFMTIDDAPITSSDPSSIRETCRFFGSCKTYPGRRFEVWVR